MNAFNEGWLDELPIVGILRGFSRAQISALAAAALRGGLRNLEITMNTPGAAELIRMLAQEASHAMNIGAGTVLTLRDLEEAAEAGAAFIVTPALRREVIVACRERGLPVFPGAFSPAEVMAAWEWGARMVKIFPSEAAGPGYIASLKGEFPRIDLMPTGGVSLDTLSAFARAGASGFGIGGPLFDKKRIEQEDWTWVENQCRACAALYAEARSTPFNPEA